MKKKGFTLIGIAVLTAAIAFNAALVTACDNGTEEGTGPNTNPNEQPKTEPDKKTWRDVHQQPVNPITSHVKLIGGNPQSYANDVINIYARGSAHDADSIYRNINEYEFSRFVDYDQSGFPGTDFTEKLGSFVGGSFVSGHRTPNGNAAYFDERMLPAIFELNGIVAPKDRALFAAYANAHRGVNFMLARYDVDDDYTTQFDLGTGPVTMADLIQNINDSSNGTVNYPLSGKYPTDLRAKTATLVADADNAYPHMVNDVITFAGNIEQLLGILQRARALGYSSQFTPEAMRAIVEAVPAVTADDIRIDKRQSGE